MENIFEQAATATGKAVFVAYMAPITNETVELFNRFVTYLDCYDLQLILASPDVCNHQSNITMNFHLLELPSKLQDYAADWMRNDCPNFHELWLAEVDAKWWGRTGSSVSSLSGIDECRRIASQVLSAIKPVVSLFWSSGVFPVSKIWHSCANQLGLPAFCLERGFLPGTWMLDSQGMNSLSDARIHPVVRRLLLKNNQTDCLQKYLKWYVAKYGDIRTPNKTLRKKIVVFGSLDCGGIQPRSLPGAFLNSPGFSSSLELLNAISDSVGDGVELIFRPHPGEMQLISDSVVANALVDKTTSSLELLRSADVVVTGMTTLTFEALLLGKPVVLAARSACYGVGVCFEALNPSEIPEAIKNALNGLTSSMSTRINNYLDALLRDFLYFVVEDIDLPGLIDLAKYASGLEGDIPNWSRLSTSCTTIQSDYAISGKKFALAKFNFPFDANINNIFYAKALVKEGSFRESDFYLYETKAYEAALRSLELKVAEHKKEIESLVGDKNALLLYRDALTQDRDILMQDRDVLMENSDALAKDREVLLQKVNKLQSRLDTLTMKKQVKWLVYQSFSLANKFSKLLPGRFRHKLKQTKAAKWFQRQKGNQNSLSLNYINLNSSGHGHKQDKIICHCNDSLNKLPKLDANANSDILIWGVIDWHLRFQRPQQLALGYARAGHRVIYISSELHPSKEPGFSVERLSLEAHIYQINIHIPHAREIYSSLASAVMFKEISASVSLLLTWLGMPKVISIVQHPFWLQIARSIPMGSLVYDCMDHHGGFENTADEIMHEEDRLMQMADLLVVTSSWLEDIANKKNQNVSVIRNAGDYAHFSVRPKKVFQDEKGRKVLGYYGAIAEWFDIEFIRKLAIHFSDCLILLIGDDTVGAKKILGNLPNIKFTGEVAYADLPYYLYGFDVCLLPFKVIELTLATNPVKVYEYLGAGKPVVSIDLPEISQFESLVFKASDHEQFIEQCKIALEDSANDPSIIDERRDFASQQTWLHRAEAFDVALSQLHRPKVSVIVLTYNNLHLTKRCLASLERSDERVDLEIIVVDNASSDQTPTYLQEYVKQHPQVKILLSKENRGFAAGNNLGLAMATGDYLVVLNNDTVVTPGWAMGLVRHLQNDEKVGLVGPVTNNIGNESKIEIYYPSLEMMPIIAQEYTSRHLGQTLQIPTLAFFCVMMPRKVYEQVGGLDEAFGLGFFEDDDYCRRVEQAGFKCLCADDVFVHHNLSASFNKLGAERKQQLMERNLAIYEAKWGKWVPHQYRVK